MKALMTVSTLLALGVAAVNISAVSARADASAPKVDYAVINGVKVPINHVGPGVGSVKAPPFIHLNDGGDESTVRLYHTASGRPAEPAAAVHVGPGPWSSKTPYAR